MSHAQSNSANIHDDRDHEYGHDDRHPALTPLVIDLIPDQTQAELEASIDESLAIDRGPAEWDNESTSTVVSDAHSGANHD